MLLTVDDIDYNGSIWTLLCIVNIQVFKCELLHFHRTLYSLYSFFVTALFILALPVAFPLALLRKKYRTGLPQRLGFGLDGVVPAKSAPRVWMHASSVGEVQAAKALISELMAQVQEVDIVVSTMTSHGRHVAIEQLPSTVCCIISPLDIPFITARTVRKIQPDVYVCLETELWPSILKTLNKAGVDVLLLNGRMSVRSLVTYTYFKRFFREVLANFNRMAFISTADMKRFVSLGADQSKCRVSGNVKYDLPLPEHKDRMVEEFRRMLFLQDRSTVFISGSTHTGEEDILAGLYKQMSEKIDNFIWMTAPRHLERLASIESALTDQKLNYERYTELKQGKKREHNIILIDVMGELANLYSLADYVFCGGSLVEKGGHNIMEAALWDKAVFYGPYMNDYKDAVALLEFGQAGIKVQNADELREKILYFWGHQDEYDLICHRAGTIAEAQNGASKEQAGFIRESLKQN